MPQEELRCFISTDPAGHERQGTVLGRWVKLDDEKGNKFFYDDEICIPDEERKVFSSFVRLYRGDAYKLARVFFLLSAAEDTVSFGLINPTTETHEIFRDLSSLRMRLLQLIDPKEGNEP